MNVITSCTGGLLETVYNLYHMHRWHILMHPCPLAFGSSSTGLHLLLNRPPALRRAALRFHRPWAAICLSTGWCPSPGRKRRIIVNLVGKFRKADVMAHAVGQVESSIWMTAAGGARVFWPEVLWNLRVRCGRLHGDASDGPGTACWLLDHDFP